MLKNKWLAIFSIALSISFLTLFTGCLLGDDFDTIKEKSYSGGGNLAGTTWDNIDPEFGTATLVFRNTEFDFVEGGKVVSKGTWSQSGNVVTLNFRDDGSIFDGFVLIGTISDNTLTLSGFFGVFTRR